MMQKLLFAIESPMDQRDYHRFGVDYLSEYYDVVVLDCTPYIYPAGVDRVDFDATRRTVRIASRCDLNRMASDINRPIVIDLLGGSITANVVRRKILEHGGVRIVFRLGGLHFTPLAFGGKLKEVIGKFWRLGSMTRVLSRMVARLHRLIMRVPPVDITVLAGRADEGAAKGLVVYGHSFDYERWLCLRTPTNEIKGRYAIFLDEDIVYHPDYPRFGVSPPVTESAYYTSINKFFDNFEKITGIPVYVAAHPRSKYFFRPHLWGARRLIHGETPEVVAGADIVFAHYSTSISFAVLSRKPIIHLVSDEMLNSFMGPQVMGVSDFLGTELINIDDVSVEAFRFSDESVNLKKYAAYKDRYLKTIDSKDAPLWEIVTAAVADYMSDSRQC